METKVLTQEELQSLKELSTKQNDLIVKLGQIEYQTIMLNNQKDILQENIKQLEKENLNLGKVLTEKYGNGTLNLETGEITIE
jgi:ethanolamine ammonia-lyase small subunit